MVEESVETEGTAESSDILAESYTELSSKENYLGDMLQKRIVVKHVGSRGSPCFMWRSCNRVHICSAFLEGGIGNHRMQTPYAASNHMDQRLAYGLGMFE